MVKWDIKVLKVGLDVCSLVKNPFSISSAVASGGANMPPPPPHWKTCFSCRFGPTNSKKWCSPDSLSRPPHFRTFSELGLPGVPSALNDLI
jgi:hypothetical protein